MRRSVRATALALAAALGLLATGCARMTVNRLLAEPDAASSQNRFRDLSMEYARLEPLAQRYGEYLRLERDLATARELAAESDAETRALGEEEGRALGARLESQEGELKKLLVPTDPRDDSNIYLELRAGTGGDEAAIFAGDLLRMYAKYAESRGWRVEIMSESPGEHGGYKEVISRMVGRGAFSRLKFESGTHRVQRVPQTEAQGRIHTSTCTVAILPEMEEVEEIALERGYPERIVCDNGPEFRSQALDSWAYEHGLVLDFIQPGKPVQNPFVESFNGKMRDECLNVHWFGDLAEARRVIDNWRNDYTKVRPHSSLGYRTPAEFGAEARNSPSSGSDGIEIVALRPSYEVAV